MIPLAISTVVLLALACVGWLAYGRGAQRGHALAAELRSLRDQVATQRRHKDEAYEERNALAALLVAVLQHEDLDYQPHIHKNDGTKWKLYRGYDAHFKGWGNCLYIEPPDEYGIGQLVWHFPDDMAWAIDALGLDEHPTGWDGRSRTQRVDAILHFIGHSG